MKIKALKYIPAVIVCLLSFQSCGKKSAYTPEILTEEDLIRRLKNIECTSKNNRITGSMKSSPSYKGILSSKVNGLNLKFRITSKSLLASYKDVKVKVDLLSKTGAVIKADTLILYETIRAGETITAKNHIPLSNQQYLDFKDSNWSILGFECAN